MQASYTAMGFTTHLQHRLRIILPHDPEKPDELDVHEWQPDALLYIPGLELKVAIEMKVNTRKGRSSTKRTGGSIASKVFKEWRKKEKYPFRNITRRSTAQQSVQETESWEQITVVPVVAVSDISGTVDQLEDVSYFLYIPGVQSQDYSEFNDLSDLIEVLRTSDNHPLSQKECRSEPSSNWKTANDVDGGSVRRILLD